jgi:opacity protein-like surface antigen
MAYRLNNNLNATQSADENKSVTIYQGIAGFDFRYDCHFDVMADYRYLESRSYDVTYHNAAGANLSPLVSQRYRSNQLNLGIRYRF